MTMRAMVVAVPACWSIHSTVLHSAPSPSVFIQRRCYHAVGEPPSRRVGSHKRSRKQHPRHPLPLLPAVRCEQRALTAMGASATIPIGKPPRPSSWTSTSHSLQMVLSVSWSTWPFFRSRECDE